MQVTRRAMLAQSGAGLFARTGRLIIDTHLEVWTLDDPRFPFHDPDGRNRRPRMAAPVENQVEVMREFGIRYAVLINPRPYYGWDNTYFVYCLRKYPDLFVVQGLLDPENPNAAERLRYWMSLGLQGMRFEPIYHPKSTWLNAKDQYPLWREAERCRAVFNYYIPPHQMPMLEEMAARFPGVKIVVDHLGKPDLRLQDPWPEFRKLFRLKRFRQVWVSASEPYELSLTKQYPYRDTYPFFKAVYEEFGASKLIWGTGYPRPRWELPMDMELDFVDRQLDFYTDDERELVLGRNALNIWRFPVA